MKVGDVVKVVDGSYSMSLVKGDMQHVSGISLLSERFRVLAVSGTYPAQHSVVGADGDFNDSMLVHVNDPDFVLFIQERFCRVTLGSKTSPADTIEVALRPGTKRLVVTLDQ